MNYDEVYDYAVANMAKLCAWIAANGIRPKDVPVDARVRIEGDTIVCPVYRCNDQGRHFIENGDVARGVVRVPLAAEPGETVARWLALAASAQRGGEEKNHG